MKIDVSDQTLSITQNKTLVADSVNLYKVQFTFDETWNGFVKYVIFKKSKQVIQSLLIGDTCMIPNEMFSRSGLFQIGVVGTGNGVVKPTIWSKAISVVDGAPTHLLNLDQIQTAILGSAKLGTMVL